MKHSLYKMADSWPQGRSLATFQGSFQSSTDLPRYIQVEALAFRFVLLLHYALLIFSKSLDDSRLSPQHYGGTRSLISKVPLIILAVHYEGT